MGAKDGHRRASADVGRTGRLSTPSAPGGRHDDRAGRKRRGRAEADPPRSADRGPDLVRLVAGRRLRRGAGDDLLPRPSTGTWREHRDRSHPRRCRGTRTRTAAVDNYPYSDSLNCWANRDSLVIKQHKFPNSAVVCRMGQSGGRSGMGRRGRFVLQPRRISEIFVTSITLVTLALSGVAAAATPDRAPTQSAGTAASPAPDPARQPVRLSPTHRSAPPVTVTPVSTAPSTTSHQSTPAGTTPRPSSGRAAGTPVERAAGLVEPAKAQRRTPVLARKHRAPAAHQQHRTTGPVTVNLALPRISPPHLVANGRAPGPNGVLLLLSSLSLGLLVVASLTLLRRVKRLNGGWWA